jgi:putative methyltransferase (TIGR04325 family)
VFVFESKCFLANPKSSPWRRPVYAVLSGEANFQRDGILLEQVEYNWPSLSALLVAQVNSNKNHVLDVGGGFGQTAFQNFKYVSMLPKGEFTVYSILEQPEIVKLSTRLVQNNLLISFYSSIEDVPTNFDIVYFGSSAPYIENFYEILKFLEVSKPTFIIFDRTPIAELPEDIFYVEKPPQEYYSGSSYPVRIFSRSKFVGLLVNQMGYQLVSEWEERFQPYPRSKSMGYFFKLRSVRVDEDISK